METDILILSVTMVGMVTMFLLKRNSKKKFEELMAECERNHKGRTCRGMGCKDDKWH